MRIHEIINQMENDLNALRWNPNGSLLTQEQSAVVMTAVLALKDLSRGLVWATLMRAAEKGTQSGIKSLYRLVNDMGANDCMAGAAHDLIEFRDMIPFG